MSVLMGTNFVGRTPSRGGSQTSFHAHDPVSGATLEPGFPEATRSEIDRAVRLAEDAFHPYSALPPSRRAAFLRAVATRLVALGETLLTRASLETGLPTPSLQGEVGRTVGQIEMFAALLEEGSWVDARLDRALPDQKPPRPDLRRMFVPVGPVVVFGSSNFPLAFSVAGGDTVSALATGCPVVVKAHPAHPGVSELTARVVLEAADEMGMPDGVFSMLHGMSHLVGHELAVHPLVKAVAFTGSHAGGRALFDAAARRDEPIPVYAEMGSSNPVFVLPEALAARGEAIARGLSSSVTRNAGQFCTNPGLTILAPAPAAEGFLKTLGERIGADAGGTMVHAGIKSAFDAALSEVTRLPGVAVAARASAPGPFAATTAHAALLVTDAGTYARHPRLSREIYGPATLAVRCAAKVELLDLARGLPGHLTATVHGTERDLQEHAELLTILRRRVGRIVVNGFPTGVEVCASMQHGGPYPATTDPRSTSVGTAAVQRFVRPVCFQDVPAEFLPEELRDENPRGIWRLVDGAFRRDPR